MSEENVRLNPRTENMVGRQFGVLTVVSFAGYQHSARWLCRCECGRDREVFAFSLKTVGYPDCLCDSRHPDGKVAEVQPEWSCYMGMIDRCLCPTNKHYAQYGGRGITVCKRWRRGFWLFLKDMGPRPSPGHSIDRINNGGNYEPENCRWATMKEQQRNTRANRLLTHNGETMPMATWAERFGMKYTTLKGRISMGWPVARALTIPVRGKVATND